MPIISWNDIKNYYAPDLFSDIKNALNVFTKIIVFSNNFINKLVSLKEKMINLLIK
jgi:hypothetical protein